MEYSTGNPLMRGTVPLMREAGGPPQEGSFHFASRLQEKEPKLQKATKMSMKAHVSSLHAPIYRNFYLCVEKKKVQTLRCRATCESLCANGSVPCTAAETIARTNLASFA